MGALSAEVGVCGGSTRPPESRQSVTWLEYSSVQLAWLLAPWHLKSVFRVAFPRERGFSFKVQIALRGYPSCSSWFEFLHSHAFIQAPAEMKVPDRACDWWGSGRGWGHLQLGASPKEGSGSGTWRAGMWHAHIGGDILAWGCICGLSVPLREHSVKALSGVDGCWLGPLKPRFFRDTQTSACISPSVLWKLHPPGIWVTGVRSHAHVREAIPQQGLSPLGTCLTAPGPCFWWSKQIRFFFSYLPRGLLPCAVGFSKKN